MAGKTKEMSQIKQPDCPRWLCQHQGRRLPFLLGPGIVSCFRHEVHCGCKGTTSKQNSCVLQFDFGVLWE